jgi:carbonic anhydrase/acetyltransferase-like protein (isoleucine patch superfamily)
VLKASTVRVGEDSVLGAGAVVLYDTDLEGDLVVDALTLVMKGETLPAGTAWAGIPAAWTEVHVPFDPGLTA